MNKPFEILQIERGYNLTLFQLPFNADILNNEFRNHYEQDEKENIIGINLSGNEITNIRYIESLKFLVDLDLSQNQINEIRGLENLYRLENLDLSFNKISKIQDLDYLSNLRTLDLSGNNIQEISNLKTLKNLLYLNLSNNNLKEIKNLENQRLLINLNLDFNIIERIENLNFLIKLENLSISSNKIVKIENLDNLKSLTHLNLTQNKISEISNLDKLASLEELHIWANYIKEIKGLSNLKNLKVLFLSHNRISKIEALENLVNLEELYLYDNEIREINNLDSLTKLFRLDLDKNKIHQIKGLDNLKLLKSIDLSYNLITDISYIFDLNNNLKFNYIKQASVSFDEVNLYQNPLDEFLTKILQIEDLYERKKQLINYFENLKHEQRPLRETKLMILGEGEAGKTNLRNFILEQPFKVGKSATTGIKIDIWNQRINDFDYRINIWDFGGQWIQQQVHQFFITNESIYIVLLNARQDEKPEKWLDWIKNYAQESLVFLVANKMDENSNFKLEENALRTEYPFIKGFSYISLFKANEGVEEEIDKINILLTNIKRKVLEIRNINTPIPANYHDLKNDLEDNYLKGNPSLSFDLFKKDLYDLHKVSGEPEDLLEILQKIGTVRFFKNFDKLILSPEWLSDGVYKILMSKLDNEKHGILTDAELKQIILTPTEECSHQYRDSDVPFIRQLMQDFKLAYFKENQCFIPSQFDKDLPKEIDISKLIKEANLIFYFEFFAYFPTNIISKFIVDFFGKVDGEKYWETGIVLKDIDSDLNKITEATIISDDKVRRITIFLNGDDIRPFFSEIHKNILTYLNQTKFKYKEFILIPKYGNSVNYRDLILYYKKDRKEISLPNLLNDDIIDLNVKDTLGLLNNDKQIDDLKKQLEESEKGKIIRVETYIETQNNFEKESTFDRNQFGGKNNKQEN